MKNYAKTSGILSIISGVFGLMGMIIIILMIFMFRSLIGLEEIDPGTDALVMGWMIGIYAVSAAFAGIFGVLSIIGGVYALQRRYWGLALTAAILATINFFPTGIPAVIFAALGKSEFEVAATDADVTSI